jgi:HKD family nuclease
VVQSDASKRGVGRLEQMSAGAALTPEPAWRSLLRMRNDRAAVIGLPQGFDIAAVLRSATAIRLATAFAHVSGWKLVAEPIRNSRAVVQLLTGLDFFQTEPKLLRKWSRLSKARSNSASVSVKLADSMFHPKVLIVTSAESAQSFAIVGSANLSAGGMCTNIECSLYTSDPAILQRVTGWFDQQWQAGQVLTEPSLKAYESAYHKMSRLSKRLKGEQQKLSNALEHKGRAVFRERLKAVSAAKKYFSTSQFERGYEKRIKAAQHISQILHFPDLVFSKREWDSFFRIRELGRLRPVYRDIMFAQRKKLQQALAFLLDERVPIRSRLGAILDRGGKYRVRGFGMNLISKILAVSDPNVWPVYNSPVEQTLRHFGYEDPRGVEASVRYLSFADEMNNFMRDSGAKDMLALDGFFRRWSQSAKKVPRTAPKKK